LTESWHIGRNFDENSIHQKTTGRNGHFDRPIGNIDR